jgi:hypothetical protein
MKMHSEKVEEVARKIEKAIRDFSEEHGGDLHIDGGELRDILREELDGMLYDRPNKNTDSSTSEEIPRD